MPIDTGFSGFWFDDKFQDLPTMFYFPKSKKLDLTRSCINIVPAALKGVDTIVLRDRPIAIALDFKGQVMYEWGTSCFTPLSDKAVKDAKAFYKKNKAFCEKPHTWAGSMPHSNYDNLPNNMRFIVVDGYTFLDLRQSNVAIKRSEQMIGGIKAILLPTDKANKASRLLKKIQDACLQR